MSIHYPEIPALTYWAEDCRAGGTIIFNLSSATGTTVFSMVRECHDSMNIYYAPTTINIPTPTNFSTLSTFIPKDK